MRCIRDGHELGPRQKFLQPPRQLMKEPRAICADNEHDRQVNASHLFIGQCRKAGAQELCANNLFIVAQLLSPRRRHVCESVSPQHTRAECLHRCFVVASSECLLGRTDRSDAKFHNGGSQRPPSDQKLQNLRRLRRRADKKRDDRRFDENQAANQVPMAHRRQERNEAAPRVSDQMGRCRPECS